MTMTTKLAVFYGFASTVVDQVSASFKQGGVDCLFFDTTTHTNHSDENVDLLEKPDSFDQIGARSHELLDSKVKSIIDMLGDRKIDFLVVSSFTDRELASPIGSDYTAWRGSLFEHLEMPLFLSTHLLKHLTPEARILFLFNHSAFAPIIRKGTYSVSQYALRMAVNILSMEHPETFISSALVDESSFVSSVKNASKQSVPDKEEGIEQANSSSMASFLKWLLLRVESEAFSETQWDSRDKDIQSLWQESQLRH